MAKNGVTQFVKEWQALIALLALGAGGSVAVPSLSSNAAQTTLASHEAAQKERDVQQDTRVDKLTDSVNSLVTVQAVTNERLANLAQALRRR